MNSKQAKVSVETMKEVMNDKTLRTKGEKDRRLREKKQNNTKKFMDERKTAQVFFIFFYCISCFVKCHTFQINWKTNVFDNTDKAG